MLDTKILRSIEDITRQEWDKVFPPVAEGYAFFKTLEESDFRQFSFRYILVYDGGSLVGAAPCFIVDFPLDTSLRGLAKRFTTFLRRYFPRIFTIKAVACGVPMGDGKFGIAGRRSDVLEAICASLEKIAEEEKARVVAFKEFTEEYTGILDPLLERGFSRFESLPMAVMEFGFKSFDEYLKGLSGASRYDLRRKFKKADQGPKIQMEAANTLPQDTLEDAYRLFSSTAALHHDSAFERVPIDFFSNISKNMPEKARFFLWRIENRLVAFSFALVSEDFLDEYYIGMDYSVARDYHLYFVRFRDMMEWCLKNGIRKFGAGVTAYEPKKRLDFGFKPLYIYTRHRSKIARPFFNLFCSLLKFEHFDADLRKINKAKAVNTAGLRQGPS